MREPASDPLIVVVDDEPDILDRLERNAKNAGLDPILCETIEDAIQQIQAKVNSGRLVAVITDLSLKGAGYQGWSVIKAAFELSRSLDLAVFSSYVDQQAVPYEINKLNPAFTLLPKGGEEEWDAVKRHFKAIRERWDRARQLAHDDDTRKIYKELATTYAKSSLPILIVGETGTGKESLAETIAERAQNQPNPSNSSGRRIVPVNCGALEPSLAFSELFGHTQGAFTDATGHKLGRFLEASGYLPGEGRNKLFREWLAENNGPLTEIDGMLYSEAARARSKTLFLDEVAALPQNVMPALLRVLETNDVMPLGHHDLPIRAHCRIISATNEVSVLKESSFRKDLFYRLAGAVLTLPPLRERNPNVIEDFVDDKVWAQLQKSDPNMGQMTLTRGGIDSIKELYLNRADETARAYQAGNFRSLRNLLYRAALHAKATSSSNIDTEHIKAAIRDGVVPTSIDVVLDQQTHIRQVFWNALHEKLAGVLVQESRDRFGLTDLKEWSKDHEFETAYAFLRCNLVPRMAGSKRAKYYELREIETALATGYGRGAWIGNSLTLDHVKQAALSYYALKREDLNNKKIADIVKLLQQSNAAVAGANNQIVT